MTQHVRHVAKMKTKLVSVEFAITNHWVSISANEMHLDDLRSQLIFGLDSFNIVTVDKDIHWVIIS